MKHGTFDDEDEEIVYDLNFGDDDDEFKFNDFDYHELDEEVDSDMIEPLQEQVNKTLDMFKRFKNY
jgi:hypothetical protein